MQDANTISELYAGLPSNLKDVVYSVCIHMSLDIAVDGEVLSTLTALSHWTKRPTSSRDHEWEISTLTFAQLDQEVLSGHGTVLM